MQVKEHTARVVAALALQCWQAGNATSSLGAVQLLCMLGYAGNSSCRVL